ncbi:MAG: 50S ribosomal protein L10 [Candidatus Omnitrophota bacterium]
MEEKFGITTKMYMLKELVERFESSPNFIITSYRGLSSPEVERLRKDLLKSSSVYFVVKNSVLKRAFDQLKFEDMAQFIKGGVGIGFTGDVIAASKTLVGFSKNHNSFKLSCAMIDGKVEGVERLKHMAMLPSREVLLALMLSRMMSPITGFVGALGGLLRNLVYAINEIKRKKEGGKKNG